MAFEELTRKHAEVWSSAPFENIAAIISDMHEALVDRLAPEAGEHWLDLACGTGDVAFHAARAGARVTGSDLSPTLVETAQRRAAEQGLDLTLEVADCQELHYADASFDVVSSSVGVIFAPDHERVAAELARVCRPGGRVGFTAWRRDSGVGEMFAAMSPFMAPPPAGAGSPFQWGDEAYVESMLGGSFALSFEESGARLSVPSQLRLVNYFPAGNGWTYMWERWQPAQIDRDFARVSGLSANTVRIVVEPDTFGYPSPSPVYAQRLEAVIRMAAAHGLHVELTLFDWWKGYTDVARSQQWARRLLQRYAGDERVAVVELRNEIEPGDPAAMAWARAMIPFLRAVLPGTPVTISVGAADPVARLASLKAQLGAALPDFWSFHYYGRPELAREYLQSAMAVAAPQPLFVGETGYTNGDADPSIRSAADREDNQLHYFRTLAATTAALGLPPAAPWILYDFAASASPVQMDAQEYHFGLFRVDATAKPAAGAIRSVFAGMPPDLGFNGGFEQAEAGSGETLPSLWRHHGLGVFARDTTTAHTGRASVSLAGIPGSATAHANFSTTPPQPWVSPGETTTAAVWARGAGATGSTTVSLRYYDGSGGLISTVASPSLPGGTTGWTRLSVQAAAPPGAVYLRVVLGTDADSGRVWFDDVTLG